MSRNENLTNFTKEEIESVVEKLRDEIWDSREYGRLNQHGQWGLTVTEFLNHSLKGVPVREKIIKLAALQLINIPIYRPKDGDPESIGYWTIASVHALDNPLPKEILRNIPKIKKKMSMLLPIHLTFELCNYEEYVRVFFRAALKSGEGELRGKVSNAMNTEEDTAEWARRMNEIRPMDTEYLKTSCLIDRQLRLEKEGA